MSDENYQIPGGFRWYQNPSLKEIVITFLFEKATSLGNAFPELFETISPECWAYFATMVRVSDLFSQFRY